MSLSYNLYFKNKISVIELVENFLIKENVEHTKKVSGKSVCIDLYNTLGYLIYIFFNNNQYFDYKIKDSYIEYEWEENTCISFDVNKFFDNYQLKLNIVEITVILLKEISTDAVLLFNGDSLILKKENSVIYINEENEFWSSSLFDMLAQRMSNYR